MEVNDYAIGPVVMQVKGLEDVTVTSPGRVSQVFVTKGQYVRVGQPLLELHSNLEEVESQGMQQEFRSQLAAGLLDPLSAEARQTLSSLRTQMELSEARLSERIIRATSDGVVHDVRAKPNQYLTNGQVVASILHDGAEVFSLALVLGQYWPMVKPGQQTTRPAGRRCMTR